LFVKELKVDLGVGGRGNKSKIKVVSILVLVWFCSSFGVLKDDVSDLEEQMRNAGCVVGDSSVEDRFDSLSVDLGRDGVVGWMDHLKEDCKLGLVGSRGGDYALDVIVDERGGSGDGDVGGCGSRCVRAAEGFFRRNGDWAHNVSE
jgi:hypothetical protein